MSVQTTYPGIYIEEDASLSLSINNSPTAVPVFIGKFYNLDGSLPEVGICSRITSWLDFTKKFSVAPPQTISLIASPIANTQESVPKAVQYTYKAEYETSESLANGAYAVQHYFQNGGGICYVIPLVSVKKEDAAIELAKLPELIERQQEITLIVCPEDDKTLTVDGSKKSDVYNSINTLLSNKVGYFLIADSDDGKAVPNTLPEKTAVYHPGLITSFTQRYAKPADSAVKVTGITNISTLADIHTNLADDYSIASQVINDVLEKNNKLASSPIILPPSAAVAGAYAAVDVSRGVWKAPANVMLSNATPIISISDAEQGVMNPLGINAIRSFTGRGTLIWGARTLDKTDNWRYVPVRRLFNSAERDIKRAMRFAVFEPNSQPIWEKVKAAINSYLQSLWQQGALQGNKPDEAWFVQIGKGVTMTDDDIKNGRMIIKIGMAAVRPAEFIILQFTQNIAQ